MVNLLTHFTNRSDAISKFENSLAERSSQILIFEGFSGQGKTWLIQWLIDNICKKQAIPYSLIDFDKIHAPKFDDLLASILRQEKIHQQVLRKSYSTFKNLKREISKQYELLSQIHIQQAQSGGKSNQQNIDIRLTEIQATQAYYARSQITDAWLECLENSKIKQAVFFFDTFETYLQQPQDVIDSFWYAMHEAMNLLPGLILVFGSQIPVVSSNELFGIESYKIESFDRKHSDDLLTNLGVENALYCQTVYENLALGHPFVTRMAAEAFLTIDGELIKSDLPIIRHVVSQKEAIQWIQSRIVERLPEPIKSAMQWIPLLRRFNLEMLNSILADKARSQISQNEFLKLTGYSFIEQKKIGGKSWWACHKLVRSVQSDYMRNSEPNTFNEFHKKAADYIKQKSPLHYVTDPSFVYHSFLSGSGEGYESWLAAEQISLLRSDTQALEELFDVAFEFIDFMSNIQQAEVHLQYGHYLSQQGSNKRSLGHLENALDLLKRAKAFNRIPVVLIDIGLIHVAYGQQEEAQRHLSEALEFFQKAGDISGQARVFLQLGDICTEFGNLENASKYYTSSLKLYAITGDVHGEANVALGMGNLAVLNQRYEQASQHYDSALRIYRLSNEQQGLGNALRRKAELELSLDNVLLAQQFFEEAERAYKKVGLHHGLANVDLGMGRLFAAQHNLIEAEKHFKSAWKRYEEMGSILGLSGVLMGLSDLARLKNNREEEKKYLEQAKTLLKKAKHALGESHTSIRLGLNALVDGRLNEAREYFLEALESNSTKDAAQNTLEIIALLGTVKLMMGDFDEAAKDFAHVLDHTEFYSEHHVQALIGQAKIAERRSEYELASTRYLEALDIAEDRSLAYWKRFIYGELANLEWNQGHISEALSHFDNALINTSEEVSNKEAFIAEIREQYLKCLNGFPSPKTQEQIKQALVEWTNLGTHEQKRRYLSENQVLLLSESAEKILAAWPRSDANSELLIHEYLLLIRRSRVLGIDTAFKQYKISLEERQIQPIMSQLFTLRDIESWRRFLRDNRASLLTPMAERAAERMIEINPHIKESVKKLVEILRLIGSNGIEATEELIMEFIGANNLLAVVGQWLETDDEREMVNYLEEQRVYLLTDEAIEQVEYLALLDPFHDSFFKYRSTILKVCKLLGVESGFQLLSHWPPSPDKQSFFNMLDQWISLSSAPESREFAEMHVEEMISVNAEACLYVLLLNYPALFEENLRWHIILVRTARHVGIEKAYQILGQVDKDEIVLRNLLIGFIDLMSTDEKKRYVRQHLNKLQGEEFDQAIYNLKIIYPNLQDKLENTRVFILKCHTIGIEEAFKADEVSR